MEEMRLVENQEKIFRYRFGGLKMEKHLMEQFKKIMENETEIKDIELYYNIEGDWVISYVYNDQKYLLNIMELL